jgi:hypothetical protein
MSKQKDKLMSTKTYTEIPDEQKIKNKEREKKTYIQKSRLKNQKELQLHHNYKKNPVFDCAVALCTMQNALLVKSNLT